MIETIIYNYLNENLDNITAYMERPAEEPTTYVLIEKTGSGGDNYIKRSTLTIQSIADSLYNAALLNEEIISLMSDAIILDQITKVEVNSDYNFTDGARRQYRYQAVFDITHY